MCLRSCFCGVFFSEKSYLYEPQRWASACAEPRDVVVWNVALFSTIMAVNVLQALFCVGQILSAIHGMIFGPGSNKVRIM